MITILTNNSMPGGDRFWSWVRRTFRRYLSPDQMADHIYSKLLDDSARREWGHIVEKDLAMLHMTVGRSIRNMFGLWEEENPYTELNAAPNAEGIIDDPAHPDAVSWKVMELLAARCRTVHLVQ